MKKIKVNKLQNIKFNFSHQEEFTDEAIEKRVAKFYQDEIKSGRQITKGQYEFMKRMEKKLK